MVEVNKKTLARLATDFRIWPANAKRLRQEGDAAREAQDWKGAVEAYAAYLKIKQHDAAIWVQCGHALKEQGLLAEAERAYRKATALMPADAELQLHLAHLLKSLDRPDDAQKIFSELLETSPSIEVFQELRKDGELGQSSITLKQRPAAAIQGGVYIELKDLCVYLSLHTTVTGITRVTLGLINHILEDMDEQEAAKYNFVHQFRDGEGVMLLSKYNIRKMIQVAMTGNPDIANMQELIKLTQSTSILFRLERGDTYLILGAFWEFVANPSWIGGMRQRGVRIGTFIYDLIPITHHQYCMQELTEAFTVAFAETARLLDFALTISAFVANEVTEYLRANDIAPLPTVAVPLAHELRFEMEAARKPATAKNAQTRTYLANVPFVLCVCTIEARKNHAYLLSIWQRMIEARISIPDLVFVGRPGWRVGHLMDEISDSRFLNGRLHILNGLTDDELSDLYDRCLFTVFPSYVEGWGLPVGESLAHGKVCVASCTSSIPEVGGQYVSYADPFDVDAGYKIVSRLIQEPDWLAQEEKKLRENFVPRTWKIVGQDFFAKLDIILHDIDIGKTRRDLFAPTLRPSEIFDVSKLDRVGKRGASYVRNPTRLIFVHGWRGIEGTGTWMLDSQATVQVQTLCGPGARVSVLLHLGTSPWVGPHNTLAVTADADASEAAYRRPMSPDVELWLTIIGCTDDNGRLLVHITVTGSVTTAQPTNIPVAIRLRGLGYAPVEDLGARLSLLEAALLSPG